MCGGVSVCVSVGCECVGHECVGYECVGVGARRGQIL